MPALKDTNTDLKQHESASVAETPHGMGSWNGHGRAALLPCAAALPWVPAGLAPASLLYWFPAGIAPASLLCWAPAVSLLCWVRPVLAPASLLCR